MSVPTNLIPTKITGLPEYTGTSQAGYFPYVLEGTTYKVQFSSVASSGEVPPSRTITAGTGLVGGGDLSANRIFAIANGGVGANQLDTTGVVAGVYGNGSNVPTVTVDANGRVTSVTTSPVVATGYVPESRTITAGTGLIGGGSLAGNITLSLNISSATPQALGNATAGVSTAAARGDHVHPAVNLGDTNQTQGALPLGRGGTGDALSPVAGAVVYSTGTKLAMTNPGTAGQVLVSGGADEPEWRTIAGLGTVTSVNASGGSTGMTFTGGPITTSGTLTLGGTLATGSGGTGLTGTPTNGQLLIGNGTGYALSTLTAGTAVSITNAAGSITIDNTAPDQIVSLTGAGTTTISGTYPNFTITSNDQFTGTVTSVAASGGTTGLTFSGSPITSAGTLTLGGTLAVANGGTGATTASGARTNLGAAASGANSDITSLSGITGGIGTADFVAFDTTNVTPPTTGQIAWSVDDGTLDVGLYGGSTLKVGQQTLFYAKNTSGGTIPIGTPVMFTGVVGASGKLTFGLAVANGSVPPEYMMGVTTQNVVNNDFGYIASFGLVRGFNTSGAPYGETWADGDLLYFSPVTPGGWTKVEPQAPNIHVPVAVVVNAATGGSGSIFVRMIQSERLGELQDVEINGGGPAAGQVLIYDASQSRWENNTLTAGSNVTITNGNGSITIAATEQFTGTVTSVAASGGTTGLTFSGSPITSAGTLTLGGTLAIGSGGTGATTAGGARTALGAAGSGANTDITSVALTSGTILNAPTSGTDIVNKAYADSIASGINFHQSVRLATVAPLPAYTYNNGTSGVGATITANANGALSIDGVAVVAGNRVLIKDEIGAAQAYHGIYVVTQTGNGSTPFILTRATDFDSAGSGVDQIDAGDFFLVTAGNTLANTSWVQQTPLPITVGTTPIIFSQFGAPVLYSAGTGLSLAGTVFSITNTGVSANTYGSASQVPVLAVNAQGQITSASNTSISIAASQVTSGSLAVARGGTGLSTTPTNGQLLIGNGTGYSLSTLSAGTGISVSNGSGSVTVTNTAPDQIVTITGGGATVVTGTYPNFTVSTTTGTGTVTSVDVSGGSTGLSFTGGPITSSGIITMGGTLGVANGGTGATTLSSGYLLKGNGTSAVSASVIYDDGTNVGVGTSSPGMPLDVQSNASALGIRVRGRAADNFGFFQFSSNNLASSTYIGSNGSLLQFETGGSERMRITAAGDVGIGTSSPTQILTLAAANNFPFIHWNNASNTTIAFAGWHGGTGGGDDFRLGTNSTRAVAFHTNNTERMRVTAAGDVGIGTSAPGARLEAFGTDASIIVHNAGNSRGGIAALNTQRLAFASTAAADDLVFGYAASPITSGSFVEYMRIDNGTGNVGIGTASPGGTYGRLTVAGGIRTVDDTSSKLELGRFSAGAPNSYIKIGANSNSLRVTNAGDTVDLLTLTNSAELNIDSGSGGGRLTFAPGSASNNLLSTTTGFAAYNPIRVIASDIRFETGSSPSERMRIDSSGNVGIGTSSPADRLDVRSDTSNTRLRISTSDNGNIFYAGWRTGASFIGAAGYNSPVLAFDTGGSERMRIDNSGNVGINISNPSVRLSVLGNPGDPTLNAASGIAEFRLSSTQMLAIGGYGSGSFGVWLQGKQDNGGYTSNTWPIILQPSGGNVGIGTASPATRLQVETGSDATAITCSAISSTSSQLRLGIGGFAAGVPSITGTGNGLSLVASDAAPMRFGTSNTERMRIDSSGLVGIGTSSPTIRLQVTDVDQATARIGVRNLNGQNYHLVAGNPGASNSGFAIFDATASATRMYLDSSGNLLLGTTTTTNTGQVISTAGANFSSTATKNSNMTGLTVSATTNESTMTGVWFATGNAAHWSGIAGARTNHTVDWSTHLAFYTHPADFTNIDSAFERMRIDGAGNVGLGMTPAPISGFTVFDVNGNAGGGGGLINWRSAGVRVGTAYASGQGALVIGTAPAVPMIFITNSTETMRIQSSGNVGIGTSSPGNRLHVVGNIQLNTTSDTMFTNNIAVVSSAADMLLNASSAAIRFNAGGTERMRITSGGQLLVGTTSPSAILPAGSIQYVAGAHVTSGGFGRIWVPGQAIGSTTFAGLFGMASTYNAYFSGGWRSIGGGTASAITIDEGRFSFSNSNSVGAADAALTWTTRLMVDTNGNVGVGTSSPNTRFKVYGNTGNSPTINNTQHDATGNSFDYASVSATSNTGSVGLTSWASGSVRGSTGWVQTVGAIPLVVGVNDTEVARFTTAGNVGIGTTAPNKLLTLNSPTNDVEVLRINAPGGPGGVQGRADIGFGFFDTVAEANAAVGFEEFGTSSAGGSLLFKTRPDGAAFETRPTERMRITPTGLVGIGTTSPGARLDVAGNIIARTGNDILDTGAIAGAAYVQSYNNTSGIAAIPLLFYTGTAERARIDSSGNLLVGTTSNPDSSRMVVTGGSITHASTQLNTRPGTATQYEFVNRNGAGFDFYVNNASNLAFRITSTGAITSSDLADAVGYKGIPQNARTSSYTLALSDIGRHISITTGGVTIPANGSVAFPIGSAVTIYNNSASNQTISITSDTLRLAGTATTGSRTLAQRGICTCVKVAATEWVISGAGLT